MPISDVSRNVLFYVVRVLNIADESVIKNVPVCTRISRDLLFEYYEGY